MRFQELRDADGTTLAQGLHPRIAVVAANAGARAAVLAAIVPGKGCKVLTADDIDEELERASLAAAHHHEAAVSDKRSKVAEAEKILFDAEASAAGAARESSVASADVSRFDDLATRLSVAEDAYEAAVRSDAEAARSFAAALGELDRILGQRHSASTSLDQARKSRDNRGVPDAVIQQAMNLQAALAKAEAEKHDAVRQADETSQAARAASRNALLALEGAHTALRAGMALISAGAPDWGPGVPLPGLVANYRERLGSTLAAAQAAESHAKAAEQAARARLDQEQQDLESLIGAGPALLGPEATVGHWMGSDFFSQDDAVFLDNALARFGTEGVAALVNTLASRGCQVIYLTDDAHVLGWAIGLPHEAGGATTVSANRARKPALVGE